MMLFTFAGSSHSKNATYTLKMICTLELESSPALKDGILLNWLVNTEGLPRNFVEGDLVMKRAKIIDKDTSVAIVFI